MKKSRAASDKEIENAFAKFRDNLTPRQQDIVLARLVKYTVALGWAEADAHLSTYLPATETYWMSSYGEQGLELLKILSKGRAYQAAERHRFDKKPDHKELAEYNVRASKAAINTALGREVFR